MYPFIELLILLYNQLSFIYYFATNSTMTTLARHHKHTCIALFTANNISKNNHRVTPNPDILQNHMTGKLQIEYVS